MSELGPVTEKRFENAFATTAVVTKSMAAALLGLDEKTLDRLTSAGVIRAISRGAYPAYTEGSLRGYLASSHTPARTDTCVALPRERRVPKPFSERPVSAKPRRQK